MCLPVGPPIIDVYVCPEWFIFLAHLEVTHTPCHPVTSPFQLDWIVWFCERIAAGDQYRIVNEYAIDDHLASGESGHNWHLIWFFAESEASLIVYLEPSVWVSFKSQLSRATPGSPADCSNFALLHKLLGSTFECLKLWITWVFNKVNMGSLLNV